MKILLLGEFSGVHKYLTQGLRELGHEVLFISFGDGFKKIDGDITINISFDGIHKIKKIFSFFKLLKLIKNFDVVQILFPYFFTYQKYLAYYLINYIKDNNNKLSYYACGTDPVYFHIGTRLLKYSPIKDLIKIDYNLKMPKYYNFEYLEHFLKLLQNFDFIIPSVYDYAIGYLDLNINIAENIPFPYPVPENIKFKVEDDIIILHGILRRGFKGSKFIIEALRNIEKKYSKVKVLYAEKLPLSEYIKIFNSSHLIIDQVNSYSYGINALMGLSYGKIVLSGAEKIALQYLNIPEQENAVINILPDVEQIIQCLENLLTNADLYNISQKSHQQAFKYHNNIKIAKKFLKLWGTKNN